jgi:hypothetical protein
LLDERGLPDLPRTGDDLNEAARLGEAPGELIRLRTGVHGDRHGLLNTLSKITQDDEQKQALIRPVLGEKTRAEGQVASAE